MLFDTFPFWGFLIATWAIFFICPNNRLRKLVLVAASYLFYAAWRPLYLLILFGVTAGTYFAARRIQAGRNRRMALWAGVSLALAVLGFFKYWNFFAGNLNTVLNLVSGRQIGTLEILLPIGISFYTFQAIGYLADCYRGHIEKRPGFLDYSVYLSFFPHLIAGPILRGEDFIPQLKKRSKIDSRMVWEGLLLVCFGLFKKIVLADNMSLVVDPVFADLHTNGSRIVLATYAYAVQLYCDFSGYSDMAIGMSRFFGYHLPRNFNFPYLALNPVDFWRRWHITLSNWLRDYIYFSLPGLRSKNKAFAHRNMLITMVLCGLWHGPKWTFVLWGLYQGCILVGYRLSRPLVPPGRLKPAWLGEIGSVLVMQQVTVLGWILFRVDRLGDVSIYAQSLLGNPFRGGAFTGQELLVFWLLVVFFVYNLIEWRIPVSKALLARPWNPYVLLAMVFLGLAMIMLQIPKQVPFLYFRF